MISGNCKTVDSSVAIALGIMDTSKGSLEPVRGSKVPVKVGKDMTTDEVCVLAQKNIQITIGFFRAWKDTYFFILIPNLCTIYVVQMNHLPLKNLKKRLGKPYSKICFYLCKDEEYQSSLLKGFTDSVSQMYSFL